jgi:hypothetical protein
VEKKRKENTQHIWFCSQLTVELPENDLHVHLWFPELYILSGLLMPQNLTCFPFLLKEKSSV